MSSQIQHIDAAPAEVTFGRVFEEYISIRRIKPTTLKTYHMISRLYLSDWLELPISRISKDDVLRKHAELTAKMSGSTANVSMRVARALFTFAMHKYDLSNNNVKILSGLRAWNKEKRRTGHIPEERMAEWYGILQQEKNKTARDYLLFLALHGIRRREGSGLLWKNCDLVNGSFCLENTKNGMDHYLPLNRLSWALLKERRNDNPYGKYVFSSKDGKRPFNINLMAVKKIEWAMARPFTPHDLRRTYLSVGDSLNIPLHILKLLANHKQNQDVTLGYLQINVERLRAPADLIAERIIELCGIDNRHIQGVPKELGLRVPTPLESPEGND